METVRARITRILAGRCGAALAIIIAMLALRAGPPAHGLAATATQPAMAVPAYRQANHIAVVTIEGGIDEVTLKSLERRIRKATSEGADAIVISLDTPGGEMGAMLDISNLLKDRNITPANVVAWVNPNAYSAGTFIALACREIIIVPGGTFGDAAMIQVSKLSGLQPLPPTERAKREAPAIAELVDSARRNHYDENLVLSFSRLGDGIWMLENTATGERIFVDLTEYRAIFGEDPPHIAPTYAPSASAGAASSGSQVRPWYKQIEAPPVQGPQPAGSPADVAKQNELNQSLPPTRAPLTAADRGQWRLVTQVVNSSSLLTVKSDEAVYYGLAKAVIANDAELKSWFGAKTIRRYDESWSEDLVRFLTSFWVRGLLIIIFLIGLFVELAAPGFGIFGGAALVALLILIGAPWLAGMAQWWEVLLIIIGLLLVLAELFIIPGFGVTGVAGAACLLVGLVGTFISGSITSVEGQSQMLTGLMTTLSAMFVSGIGMWIISRHLPSLPIFNRLILHTELKGASAEAAAPISLLQAMGAGARELQAGDTGTAATDLRPAGRISINNRLMDAQSAGGYIDKGTPIRIVRIGRAFIEVEEAD